MEIAKIVTVAVLASIGYGIVHDQATAHLCVEYFTIAHPPVFPTRSPFWLAVGWGIIATWWMGLVLGTALALAARLGGRPKLGLAEVSPAVRVLLVVMAGSATAAGLTAFIVGGQGTIALPPVLWGAIPADHQPACMAAWAAHATSYGMALFGGLFVIGVVWYRRGVAGRAN